MKRLFTLITAFLLMAGSAGAAEPDATEIVKKIDTLLAPNTFRAKTEMVTHRSDNTEHNYKMELYKFGLAKTRIVFSYPPDQAGTQMLRHDENVWMYLVNLKRSIRVASRQQLMGGDFSNGDLLRLNLVDDYVSTLQSQDDQNYTLELKARSNEVTYDKIIFTVRKSDLMPLEQRIYTLSGKHVKTLIYEDVKTFGKAKRPARLKMMDELDKKRWSIITYVTFLPDYKVDEDFFTLNQLGR